MSSDVLVWQPDSLSRACPICSKKYTFFNRRHHCRKCGRVVCGNCSQHDVVYLPHTYVVLRPTGFVAPSGFSDEEEDPPVNEARLGHAYKTCDECYEEVRMIKIALGMTVAREVVAPLSSSEETTEEEISPVSSEPTLIIKDSTRNERYLPRSSGETGSSSAQMAPDAGSDFTHCPICQEDLKALYETEEERERHINDCLTQLALSPDSRRNNKRNHLLVYNIPEVQSPPESFSNETLQELLEPPQYAVNAPVDTADGVAENECIICLEDMSPGDKVGRLEYCLCVFHYECIKDWFNKKKWGECPVHHNYNYE
ncbi:hypothetical protein BABINDRAFT_59426 [Babjeviella inositovora NRRL Y-12698]|uniref:RING-type E3 ubiquitin transferase n=1 Tax=Babjeviella inositovora NRRL Y-12698 TaxID=984486 RepID=A0A1E3QTG6_9ASCO|nr:uncharacterized protein BABINDRAFT_59426 [Babjeviella inositovora NRRL Y-12698]ODQ80969.1 hypothetical protein BABINDRAFT_59426 [Babjeviella inositovora NRRL Y-12698]